MLSCSIGIPLARSPSLESKLAGGLLVVHLFYFLRKRSQIFRLVLFCFICLVLDYQVFNLVRYEFVVTDLIYIDVIIHPDPADNGFLNRIKLGLIFFNLVPARFITIGPFWTITHTADSKFWQLSLMWSPIRATKKVVTRFQLLKRLRVTSTKSWQ